MLTCIVFSPSRIELSIIGVCEVDVLLGVAHIREGFCTVQFVSSFANTVLQQVGID